MTRRAWTTAIALTAVVVIVAVVGLHRTGRLPSLLPTPQRCFAEVDGRSVELDREQAENASVIASVAVRRGLPARAVSIALATAFQESKLYNLDYGDRDSLGLFQQRPSQGWGTKKQVKDPVYAANAFYDALEKVPGYQDMEITVAAQAVQRSAYPAAYAGHEADARVLASALTGNSPATFHCEGNDAATPVSADLKKIGLTERAKAVLDETRARFGDVPVGGFAPEGVDSGHMSGSTHYSGRAVDIFFRPVNEANKTSGWAVASYFVANAQRLGVATVIFDKMIWTQARSGQGWRDYDPPSRSGDPEILEHRDHVHVDVFE